MSCVSVRKKVYYVLHTTCDVYAYYTQQQYLCFKSTHDIHVTNYRTYCILHTCMYVMYVCMSCPIVQLHVLHVTYITVYMRHVKNVIHNITCHVTVCVCIIHALHVPHVHVHQCRYACSTVWWCTYVWYMTYIHVWYMHMYECISVLSIKF